MDAVSKLSKVRKERLNLTVACVAGFPPFQVEWFVSMYVCVCVRSWEHPQKSNKMDPVFPIRIQPLIFTAPLV